MKAVMFMVVVVLFTFFYLIVGEYLDRPTVKISLDTGRCLSAEGPHGPISCKEAMGVKHETIFVDPHKNKRLVI